MKLIMCLEQPCFPIICVAQIMLTKSKVTFDEVLENMPCEDSEEEETEDEQGEEEKKEEEEDVKEGDKEKIDLRREFSSTCPSPIPGGLPPLSGSPSRRAARTASSAGRALSPVAASPVARVSGRPIVSPEEGRRRRLGTPDGVGSWKGLSDEPSAMVLHPEDLRGGPSEDAAKLWEGIHSDTEAMSRRVSEATAPPSLRVSIGGLSLSPQRRSTGGNLKGSQSVKAARNPYAGYDVDGESSSPPPPPLPLKSNSGAPLRSSLSNSVGGKSMAKVSYPGLPTIATPPESSPPPPAQEEPLPKHKQTKVRRATIKRFLDSTRVDDRIFMVVTGSVNVRLETLPGDLLGAQPGPPSTSHSMRSRSQSRARSRDDALFELESSSAAAAEDKQQQNGGGEEAEPQGKVAAEEGDDATRPQPQVQMMLRSLAYGGLFSSAAALQMAADVPHEAQDGAAARTGLVLTQLLSAWAAGGVVGGGAPEVLCIERPLYDMILATDGRRLEENEARLAFSRCPWWHLCDVDTFVESVVGTVQVRRGGRT